MTTREDVERAILLSRILKRCPSSNDFLGWSEWKVSQILMERMARTTAHKGRLVDEHSMDRLNVITTEGLQIRNDVGIAAEGMQHIVPLKVLYLGNSCLAC